MIASTPLRPLAPHEIWRLAVDEEQSVARSSHLAMPGASFHLGRVTIGDGMSYAHAVDRHMLYATLDGTTRFSRGRIGRRDPINRPDAPGALSFTPAGWERAVEIGPGELFCAHIEFAPDGLDAPIQADWTAPFNTHEPKLLAMIAALATWSVQPGADRLYVESLMHAIGLRVSRVFGGKPPRMDDGWLAPAALRRVLELIEADQSRTPSLTMMATEAGLGVSAFVRAFRGTTGRTPAAFVRDRKLERAAQALAQGDASLWQIAARTGFSSASHLATAFRVQRGITPGRYAAERPYLTRSAADESAQGGRRKNSW